jgi:hypothetical protein
MTTGPGSSTTSDGVQKLNNVPMIFMFQPCEFHVVKPDKVHEWEEMMRSNVGLDKLAELRSQNERADEAGVETTSICHPGGACDCDWYTGPILA